MPRASVVVPAYNSVAFIDATMRSILAQTFNDFELVVSDHNSTDGTWEALQHYTADPRVRLSRLAPGGWAPANWNAVTDLATGEFVKLVCGDDVLYPESLAMQVAALTAHPSAVLAASARDIVDTPRSTSGGRFTAFSSGPPETVVGAPQGPRRQSERRPGRCQWPVGLASAGRASGIRHVGQQRSRGLSWC
jgi:GT2 family glycosyltransferase